MINNEKSLPECRPKYSISCKVLLVVYPVSELLWLGIFSLYWGLICTKGEECFQTQAPGESRSLCGEKKSGKSSHFPKTYILPVAYRILLYSFFCNSKHVHMMPNTFPFNSNMITRHRLLYYTWAWFYFYRGVQCPI